MNKVIIISGASSGFGAMTARELADAGHAVCAGMRDVGGRNQKAAADARGYASSNNDASDPSRWTSRTRTR